MNKDTILLITNNGMGKAADPLPQKLISKYFELIEQNGLLPNAICFYTDGVKLVCEDSPVLAPLQELEKHGVRLIVCSTCLNFFGLENKVKVGIVGGMADIIEAQAQAAKIITL